MRKWNMAVVAVSVVGETGHTWEEDVEDEYVRRILMM